MSTQKQWDGIDRRAMRELPEKTDDELWKLLHEIKESLVLHMRQEAAMRPKLEELVTILERSKGIIVFLKLCLYIGAPLGAFIAWAKDHVKL